METVTRPWFENPKCFQGFGVSASHHPFLPSIHTLNSPRMPHIPVETQRVRPASHNGTDM